MGKNDLRPVGSPLSHVQAASIVPFSPLRQAGPLPAGASHASQGVQGIPGRHRADHLPAAAAASAGRHAPHGLEHGHPALGGVTGSAAELSQSESALQVLGQGVHGVGDLIA